VLFLSTFMVCDAEVDDQFSSTRASATSVVGTSTNGCTDVWGRGTQIQEYKSVTVLIGINSSVNRSGTIPPLCFLASRDQGDAVTRSQDH
jgi:hypothetical protein